MSLLIRGVRYRFASGVRRAMRLWGTLSVALVVAAGLEVPLPLLRWAREWAARPFAGRVAFAALIVAVLVAIAAPLLRRSDQLALLPLSRAQRMTIDALTIELFLLPPVVVMVASVLLAAGPLRAIEALLLLALGATASLAVPQRTRRAANSLSFAALHADVRWLLRAGVARMLGANVFALMTVAATELAIRNNDVVRLSSIARIAGLFATIGAAVLAAEIARARTAMRPLRALESTLPISPASRLRAMLVASFAVAAPFLVVLAVVRPIALPLAMLMLSLLVLLAEQRVRDSLVLGIGCGVAIVPALDARLALVLAAVGLPFAWRGALRVEERVDVPVIAEPAP